MAKHSKRNQRRMQQGGFGGGFTVARRFPMPVWLFERVAGTDLTTMWRWLRTN